VALRIIRKINLFVKHLDGWEPLRYDLVSRLSEEIAMALTLNSTIFRAYDIRGIVGVDLDESIYTRLGQAVGTMFVSQGRRSMVVGRDARLSSPQFQQALITGLRSTGIDVVDIGQVATPVMYFAVEHLGADGGAIVSASHNPPQYNGLKLRRSHPTFASEPLNSADIQEIGRIAQAGSFATGKGTLDQADVSRAYIESVAGLLQFAGRSPRVVIDAGNGVAGPIAVQTYQALGLEVVPLFTEPDGNFPNHHPDPLKKENLQDLMRAVREHDAQIGIGLDGRRRPTRHRR
jgi:phosphomannomutase